MFWKWSTNSRLMVAPPTAPRAGISIAAAFWVTCTWKLAATVAIRARQFRELSLISAFL